MGAILQTIFWNAINFNHNFTEICSKVFNKLYVSIGSDNDLALMRWQAIIWTSDGLIYWSMYVSVGLSELNHNHSHKKNPLRWQGPEL